MTTQRKRRFQVPLIGTTPFSSEAVPLSPFALANRGASSEQLAAAVRQPAPFQGGFGPGPGLTQFPTPEQLGPGAVGLEQASRPANFVGAFYSTAQEYPRQTLAPDFARQGSSPTDVRVRELRAQGVPFDRALVQASRETTKAPRFTTGLVETVLDPINAVPFGGAVKAAGMGARAGARLGARQGRCGSGAPPDRSRGRCRPPSGRPRRRQDPGSAPGPEASPPAPITSPGSNPGSGGSATS